MLTYEEGEWVAARLVDVVQMQGSPRATVASGLPSHLQAYLGEGTPLQLVAHAIALCKGDGHKLSPPAIVRLLQHLLPDHPEAAQISARLMVPPPAAPDPFEAVVLRSRLPFLERGHMRAAVRNFLDLRPTQPVIVVNGDPRLGKSYTAEFVDHILYDLPNVKDCRIVLDPHQAASTGAADLARDMVTIMGGDPTTQPQANTNLDRWAQELSNWVISAANASGDKWWFVLDGLKTEVLRPETALLITKLARSLTSGVPRDRHRLILIDFDRSCLPLQPGLIADQTATPIPHIAIRAAVAKIVGSSPHAVHVDEIAAKIVDGLDNPVSDLPELGLRLSDLIEALA